MYRVWSRRALLKGAGLLSLLLPLAAAVPSSPAQDRQTRYAIERAQIGVSGKIIQERGGDWSNVTYDQSRTQTWHVSDRQTGVRGQGNYSPPGGGIVARTFNYEAVVDHRNGSIIQVSYNFVGGGGGRDDSRLPRWLVGSFDGRSPSNRRRATVTVTRSGEIWAVYDNGTRERGTYDNGRIRFDSASNEWDVSRVDEGFRAAAGQRSEVFSRASAGDNENNNDDDGGSVPRWARGRFRGTTDSGETELTIRADGTATARAVSRNQTYQGTYANGRLRFDWGTFEVERASDGIRTVQVNNRNNQTTYHRTGDY